MKIFTPKDEKSGSTTPIYARQKGAQDGYVVAAVTNRMDNLGYPKAIFKFDPEPSTLDVQKAVGAARKKTTILRQTPKGSKGSRGGAEGAHKKTEGMFRTMLASLASHVGESELTHRVIPRTVRQIGWTIDSFRYMLATVKPRTNA